MTDRRWRLALCWGGLAATCAPALAAQAGDDAGRCAAPAYHQFDFWLGDWDAYDRGGADTPIARNQITTMVGGCAIREVYHQNDGLLGESFSMYDAARRRWHQSWVTNRGQLLVIEGEWHEGRMTLQGEMPVEGGRPLLLRGLWSREGEGVRELAETSADSGGTWKTLFDIQFRPHRRY